MIARLLCAGACVLSLAASADAQSGTGLHTHKHASARHAKKVRAPAPPKDPYANYWNDPSRQAPPFSWGGHDVK